VNKMMQRLAWVSVSGILGLGALLASSSLASADQLVRQCDWDGDDCRTYVCDWDGDDCRPVHQQYYAPPAYAQPHYYNPGYYQQPSFGFYWHSGGRHRWHQDDDDDD